MFEKLLNKIPKWKEKLIKSLLQQPIGDRELIIEREQFIDKNFIVSYFHSKEYLCFKIYHYKQGISKLSSVISNNSITIGDILCIKNNQGYGSILLSELINFAKSNNYESIDGWLSASDILDHKERLFRFYEKFDFDISEDSSSNTNRVFNIRLRLVNYKSDNA